MVFPREAGCREVVTRTFADDFAELRPDEVRRGVHLARLEQVEPGDVFYLLGKPGEVWARDNVTGGDTYMFVMPGDDRWFRAGDVGDPRARVMVLHNTRGKVPGKLAGDAGGD